MKTIEAIAPYNPIAIEQARTDALAEYDAAAALTIGSDDDAKVWAEIAREVARKKKAIDDMRDSVLKPLRAAVEAATALFAPSYDALGKLDRHIRAELGRWTTLKATQQREQMQLAAKAANAGDTQALTTALNKVQSAAPVKLEGVSVRQVWVAEVVQPDAVPREWCVPDEKALARYAKGTPANVPPVPVPGVRFTLSTTSTVRK